MTMENDLKRQEALNKAHRDHADVVAKALTQRNEDIDEAWKEYELSRIRAQAVHDLEIECFDMTLAQEVEAIDRNFAKPQPEPEIDPLLRQDITDPGLEFEFIPFEEYGAPGVEPAGQYPFANLNRIEDLLTVMRDMAERLSRSPGETKVITDGIDALLGLLADRGSEMAALLRADEGQEENKGGDHENDQSI